MCKAYEQHVVRKTNTTESLPRLENEIQIVGIVGSFRSELNTRPIGIVCHGVTNGFLGFISCKRNTLFSCTPDLYAACTCIIMQQCDNFSMQPRKKDTSAGKAKQQKFNNLDFKTKCDTFT